MAKPAHIPATEIRISVESYCAIQKMNRLNAIVFKKYANSLGTGDMKTVADWDTLKKSLYHK